MSTPRSIGNLINRNVLQLNGLCNNLPEKKAEADPQPQFTHPILAPEDFKRTLANYNRYIKQYNMEVWIEQKDIRLFNREVIRHRRNTSITREQKMQEFLWKEEHKELEPTAYNAAVEKYNTKHGPQIRKRNLRHEVKPETEKYFLAFLYQYNAQLFQRKDLRIGLNVHVPGDLPKFQLYPNKIIEAEKDGCKILPVSVETVRSHRERLQEAGALTDYSYHGPNRPVKIAFNPEILSITDNGTPKTAANENQPLTGSQTKKVPHNNVSSSLQCLEENKSSDKGVAPDEKSGSTHKDCTRSSTRTPRKQDGKKPGAADKEKNKPGRENSEKYTEALNRNELSTVLTASLSASTDLAQDLANGKHDHYKPIHRKIAQQEAYYGAMHPTDFRELAIQDVFKYAASLFSGINAHPGSWMNAYKIWMAEEFRNFNDQQLNKPNLFSRWMKMIEVLRQVKKYQARHTGYQPTFPSLYFDTARKGKEHNSFAYAFNNFKLDPDKAAGYQERKAKANKTTRFRTDMEKARAKTRQYLKGQCHLQDVYDYVRNVCSPEIWKGINNLIKKEYEKYNA